MNNNLFKQRCEVIVTTMRASNFESVTAPVIAKWLEINDDVAGQVCSKLVRFRIFDKEGAARNTRYVMNSTAANSLKSAIDSNKGDVTKGVEYFTKWYLDHKKPTKPIKEIKAEGRRLLKIESSNNVDQSTQQAIESLMGLIQRNKDLQAEVDLLKEEVQRLQQYERVYKQLKDLL